MTINPYFKSFTNNANEQSLINGLFAESIQIHGADVYYVKRDKVKEDYLFGEDTLSSFTEYFTIEMYLSSVEGYGDQTDLMSKFGLEIKDNARMEVSRPRFLEITDLTVPREGDLIYFPLSNSLFIIKFVEDEEQFYPLGTLPTFKFDIELFTYSREEMDTGIDEIDIMEELYDDSDTGIGTDPYADNTEIETEADPLVTPSNPFGEF